MIMATEKTADKSIVFTVPLNVKWNPKEDISTFELAQALKILLQYRGLMPDEFNALPDTVKRHFQILD